MLNTLTEHYVITDKNDSSRERGLLVMKTTMTQGQPLYAHGITITPLEGETLSGEYSLDFVSRAFSGDMYARIRSGQGVRANDPRSRR